MTPASSPSLLQLLLGIPEASTLLPPAPAPSSPAFAPILIEALRAEGLAPERPRPPEEADPSSPPEWFDLHDIVVRGGAPAPDLGPVVHELVGDGPLGESTAGAPEPRPGSGPADLSGPPDLSVRSDLTTAVESRQPLPAPTQPAVPPSWGGVEIPAGEPRDDATAVPSAHLEAPSETATERVAGIATGWGADGPAVASLEMSSVPRGDALAGATLRELVVPRPSDRLDLRAVRSARELGRMASVERLPSLPPADPAPDNPVEGGAAVAPPHQPARRQPRNEPPASAPGPQPLVLEPLSGSVLLDPPRAPEVVTPPSPSIHAAILARVAETVESTARDALLSSAGEGKATLHINPPRFGEIQVEVRLDADQRAHVTLQVMEDAALRLLEGEADDLVESLLAQRLELAELQLHGSVSERPVWSSRLPEPPLPEQRGSQRTPEEDADPDDSPRPRSQSRHQGDVDTQA